MSFILSQQHAAENDAALPEEKIRRLSEEIAKNLRHDLAVLAKAAKSPNKGKPVKTRGKYTVGQQLEYTVLLEYRPTRRRGCYDSVYEYDLPCPRLDSIQQFLKNQSDNPVRRACASPTIDLSLSPAATLEAADVYTHVGYLSSYRNAISLTFIVDLQKPFGADQHLTHTSAEGWPLEAFIPDNPDTIAFTPGSGLATDDEVDIAIAGTCAQDSAQAATAVKDKARALYHYVTASFDQKNTPSIVDRLKGCSADHHLSRHISDIRSALIGMPEDKNKAAIEHFITQSTSAFWLGRAWWASEAARDSSGNKRIAHYCTMRDHARTAWAAAQGDDIRAFPLMVSHAEAMPDGVMRAVRARYGACWLAAEPQVAVGGYIAGMTGLQPKLDAYLGAAKAAFETAAAKQSTVFTTSTPSSTPKTSRQDAVRS